MSNMEKGKKKERKIITHVRSWVEWKFQRDMHENRICIIIHLGNPSGERVFECEWELDDGEI